MQEALLVTLYRKNNETNEIDIYEWLVSSFSQRNNLVEMVGGDYPDGFAIPITPNDRVAINPVGQYNRRKDV